MGINHWLDLRLHRNEFGIMDIPSQKKRVNIEHSSLLNVGDVLGPKIVEWMLSERNINANKDLSRTKHLMTVGSIIGRGRFDVTVWGSGILKESGIKRMKIYRQTYHRKMDFRAIRGPISRDLIQTAGYTCPEIYGDPAVLMPLIFPVNRDNITKKYDVSVILHHRTAVSDTGEDNKETHTINIPPSIAKAYNIHFIDPRTDDYSSFITELVSSKRVVSSSLHGIILAETYGVPTVFLNWGMEDQQVKFHDWYLSTGREMVCYDTLEAALEAVPTALPDLDPMREALIKSFPYDLWEE